MARFDNVAQIIAERERLRKKQSESLKEGGAIRKKAEDWKANDPTYKRLMAAQDSQKWQDDYSSPEDAEERKKARAEALKKMAR